MKWEFGRISSLERHDTLAVYLASRSHQDIRALLPEDGMMQSLSLYLFWGVGGCRDIRPAVIEIGRACGDIKFRS